MATVTTRAMTDKERRFVQNELEDEQSRIPTTGNAGKAFMKHLKYVGAGVYILLGLVLTFLDDFVNGTANFRFRSGLRFKKNAEDKFGCDEFVDAIVWDEIEKRYTRPA